MKDITLRKRYKILDFQESGSFGDTYIAKDLDLPGTPRCVVKQLKPKTFEHEVLKTARRLFDKEAEVLYRLGNLSSQIPKLYAHFEENDEFYLVQEFVDGHTLTSELIPGILYSEEDVIKLLTEILEVLAIVHQENIIHRDIKPQNLMRRHIDGKIVLIDFGAVKEIKNLAANSQSQVFSTIAIGSNGYMPNEQARARPKLCSDIYAVGVIGIQALTGKLPQNFDEDPANGEIIWQDEVNVSNKLSDVLTKMVRYHFSQRYKDAAEALKALTTSPKMSSLKLQSTSTLYRHNISNPNEFKQLKIQLSKLYENSPEILHTNSEIISKKFVSKNKLSLIGWFTSILLLGLLSFSLINYTSRHKISKNSLVIGIVRKFKDKEKLKNYLENNLIPENYFKFLFGHKINITLDTENNLTEQEIKNKIKLNKWDIVFSGSAINSIYAIDHGYIFTVAMYPNQNNKGQYIQSGLFVRKNSSIKSIDDFNSNTKLVLGDNWSAPGFYMPVYDLYGRTLKIVVGNQNIDPLTMVRSGFADTGAAVLTDTTKRNYPDLKIIKVSRDIPGAGVYISPELSASDQISVKQSLLQVPESIRGNYFGAGKQDNYNEFREIVHRVNLIKNCIDFNKLPVNKPVNLFCK